MYVSIDIETTGLDPKYCQIIEFGAVIDDLEKPVSELPRFQTYIRHDQYIGDAFGLAMNSDILKKIANWLKIKDINICSIYELMPQFENWLIKNKIDTNNVIVAGKNFGMFDSKFIEKLNYDGVKFHHRVIDPSMLYMEKDDTSPPSTKTCLERAGIKANISHTAIDDALLVIDLIRAKFKD